MEECDRALAQDGDGEQCLRALEPELWALCQRVEKQTAALEARWDWVKQSEEGGGSNDTRDRHSPAAAWDELNEAVWSVARYEAMTTVGLRAKGKIFRDLMAFVTDMNGLFALQDCICEISITSLIVALTGKTCRRLAVPSVDWRAILVRAGPS